jgi:hypothetical protein
MFECAACHEGKTYTGKRPSFCAECSECKAEAFGVGAHSERYPQSTAAVAGAIWQTLITAARVFAVIAPPSMSGAITGGSILIQSLSINTSPQMTTQHHKSARAVNAICRFQISQVKVRREGVLAECAECRAAIRAEQGRESEYKARKMTPARLKARRIRVSEKWNKKRVAENRMVGRQIDKYLAVWRKSDKARESGTR